MGGCVDTPRLETSCAFMPRTCVLKLQDRQCHTKQPWSSQTFFRCALWCSDLTDENMLRANYEIRRWGIREYLCCVMSLNRFFTHLENRGESRCRRCWEMAALTGVSEPWHVLPNFPVNPGDSARADKVLNNRKVTDAWTSTASCPWTFALTTRTHLCQHGCQNARFAKRGFLTFVHKRQTSAFECSFLRSWRQKHLFCCPPKLLFWTKIVSFLICSPLLPDSVPLFWAQNYTCGNLTFHVEHPKPCGKWNFRKLCAAVRNAEFAFQRQRMDAFTNTNTLCTKHCTSHSLSKECQKKTPNQNHHSFLFSKSNNFVKMKTWKNCVFKRVTLSSFCVAANALRVFGSGFSHQREFWAIRCSNSFLGRIHKIDTFIITMLSITVPVTSLPQSGHSDPSEKCFSWLTSSCMCLQDRMFLCCDTFEDDNTRIPLPTLGEYFLYDKHTFLVRENSLFRRVCTKRISVSAEKFLPPCDQSYDQIDVRCANCWSFIKKF